MPRNGICRMNPNVREVELSQGMVALVDLNDYKYLNSFSWCAANTRNDRFVAMRTDRSGEKQRSILMHRAIIGEEKISKGEVIDHVNGNPLDNRRENLRICKIGLNMKNCKKYKNNKTGFMGVYYYKRLGKWTASIQSDGKRHHLGTFDNPEDAAIAYDERAIKLHGEFATLNFIQERP